MSRSRWKVPLCCPKCFETGEAILSHTHDGPRDVRVEFLAPAFHVIPSDITPDKIDVLCTACNVSAREDFRVRRKIHMLIWAELRRLLPQRPRKTKSRARHGQPATVQH